MKIFQTFYKAILMVIRTLLRAIRDLDGLFTKLSRLFIKKRYRITGKCKKRGVCCNNIAIYLSDGFWKTPHLKSLAIKWYTFVYNFELLGEEKELMVIKFRCKYLKNNACSIYNRRPFICRNYPEPGFFDRPVFLPGCGYSAISEYEQNERL